MRKVRIIGAEPHVQPEEKKIKVLNVEKMSPTKAEALRIYQEILRTKKIGDIRVDRVILMKDRGIVTGWGISIEYVKGKYFYDIRDVRDDTTVMTIIPEDGSIIVAVGSHPDETVAVVVYKDRESLLTTKEDIISMM